MRNQRQNKIYPAKKRRKRKLKKKKKLRRKLKRTLMRQERYRSLPKKNNLMLKWSKNRMKTTISSPLRLMIRMRIAK